MWLEHSKMIVNEYRLDLTSPQGQKLLHEQAEKYFFGEGAAAARPTSSPPQAKWRRGAACRAARGDILLVSCYEPGHQPQGRGVARSRSCVAPASRRPCLDLAVEQLDAAADARLAARAAGRASRCRCTRRWRWACASRRACAPPTPTRPHLLLRPLRRAALATARRRAPTASSAPDCEEQLVALADRARGAARAVPRRHRRPGATDSASRRRDGLPALERYARLAIAAASGASPGHAEATRGCKHLCRHCPIPPVYGGRFFAVPADVVLDDVAPAGRGGRAPHRLRRPRLPQRAHATRCASRAPCTPASRRHASASPPRSSTSSRTRTSFAELAGARRAVRRQRGGVAVRSGAGGAGQGPPRRRRGPRARRWCAAPACRCARRSWRSRRGRRWPTTWSCAASFGDNRLQDEVDPGAAVDPPAGPARLAAARRAGHRAVSSGRWTRRRSPTAGPTPTRAWTSWRPTSRRWSKPPPRPAAPAADTFARIHQPGRDGRRHRPAGATSRTCGCRPPPPHLTEPWFCCAQPTRRQLRAV